jgi:hypothetical protein
MTQKLPELRIPKAAIMHSETVTRTYGHGHRYSFLARRLTLLTERLVEFIFGHLSPGKRHYRKSGFQYLSYR